MFAGYALSHKAVAKDQLKPYVDTVMDELEYIKGDITTKFGALRASHGHPDPFKLDHIEIGNEDYIGKEGQSTYQFRFDAFAKAIREKYPSMTLVSTWDGISFPNDTWSDEHFYPSPKGLIDLFHRYDRNVQNRKIIVGEYACRYHNNGTIMQWPNVLGSIAEAVFAIGAERNSRVVQGLAYAPLLANVSPGSRNLVQWHPNLVSFTTDRIVLSTSYYVQQLLSKYRIKEVYTVHGAVYGPLYFVAGKGKNKSLFVKVANPTAQAEQFDFSINIGNFNASTVSAEGVFGDPLAFNSLENSPISIKNINATIDANSVSIQLPAYSFTVVVVEP